MAILESRPYLTPERTAVKVDIQIVEPATGKDSLSTVWEPGQQIKLRFRATLSESFWTQTQIEPDEPVQLVGVASCLPARATWRQTAHFEKVDGEWRAESMLDIDGSVIAVEVKVDAWVVGSGRIVSDNPFAANHTGAKLWQLVAPLVLKLENNQAAFPTTAISFDRTGRLQTPWIVELNPSAEPDWRIDSAVRLYVNTDLPSASALLDGSAPDDYYSLIQCDIQFAILHHLASWADSVPVSQIATMAEADHTTMAAFGSQISKSLGLPLVEALRIVVEEPVKLTYRSREAFRFGHKVTSQR
ncbi:hypothetical protein [Brevibacterium sp. UCMA 11752]|uniref:hypothetical protein n=1 Tax=Brevibacterium sp. UCMA 11752 TaxID=2745946 RepID=UPI001F192306|nr:hypothetical protein [Brevibacterium sp. UCMA 11752]MCF2586106.1 hypothetical protein [Brevibacterium sp. UCMA 11752]